MAVNNVDDWIPEEPSSEVIQRVNQMSVVERLARVWTMSTRTRSVPRSAGMDVEGIAAGGTYTEDASLNDEVILLARKMGKALRLDDEDLQDSTLVDILNVKKLDWAISYAKFFDQACIGTTGAENGTTILFTSIYKALRTTNADTGYTADANYVASASGTAVSYDNLSGVLSLAEQGDYWDDSRALVIAHPGYKAKLRGIKDNDLRPVFIEGQGGDKGTPSTLFGYPIEWSLGARTHATNSANPSGNQLLTVGNRDYFYKGVRSGPESVVAGADTGIGFLTDQAILKVRARRGFAVAHEKAWAVLEDL